MIKTKITELDYLRGLAIIAIVMQHLMGYINYPNAVLGDIIVLSVTWHFINFGLAAFVFISGAACFYNYGCLEDFKYTNYIKKRARQVLIPYLLWSLFYYYYHNQQLGLTFRQLMADFGYNLITGQTSYHLWYIVLIFQFYLLFPVLLKTVDRVRMRVKTEKGFFQIVTGFFLICMLLNWFLLTLLPAIEKQSGSLGLFHGFNEISSHLFVAWIFYFILGGLVGLYPAGFKQWVGKAAPYNMLVWLGLFFYLLYNYSNAIIRQQTGFAVLLNTYPLHRPLIVLFTLSTIINLYRMCIWLSFKNKGVISKALLQINKYSFSIYLAHPFVLDLISKYLYDETCFNPAQKFFLSVFLTMLIIIPVASVIKRVSAVVNR